MLNQRLHFGGSISEPDRVVLGDNIAVLEATPDASLDLVYIDPPFGTGTTRKGRDTEYRDVPNDPDAFVTWLSPRLEHCRRALATTGSLFVHLDYRAVHYVKVALDRLFGRSRFVNEIVWCYSVGGKSRRTFARKHDTILWYARSSDYAFYSDAVRVPRKPNSHMRVVKGPDGELVQEKTDRKTGKVYRYPVNLGKVPEDWWADIETLNRGDRERTGWPTQKPERLLERIVKATTDSGDHVADWFCGSGTTAIVAQRLGRRFTVTDVLQDAVECTTRRLSEAGERLAEAGTPPRDVLVERADLAYNGASYSSSPSSSSSSSLAPSSSSSLTPSSSSSSLKSGALGSSVPPPVPK
jgi:DNA modification methylase